MMFRLKHDMTLTGGDVSTFKKGTQYFLLQTVSVNGGREWRYVLGYHDGTVALRVKPEFVEPVTEERRLFS